MNKSRKYGFYFQKVELRDKRKKEAEILLYVGEYDLPLASHHVYNFGEL